VLCIAVATFSGLKKLTIKLEKVIIANAVQLDAFRLGPVRQNPILVLVLVILVLVLLVRAATSL